MSEKKSNLSLPVLDGPNFSTWIAHVKDLVLSIDHEHAPEMYTDYEWIFTRAAGDVNDPADYDYQDGSNAEKRKLRTQHNKLFKAIRDSLSAPLFRTTLQLPNNVPKLLRHLHRKYNSGNVADRTRLRNEYQAMKLNHFADVEQYITEFHNKVEELKEQKLGLVDSDEEVLFQFNQGLPSQWDIYVAMTVAQGLTFAQSCAFYKSTATRQPNLPGANRPRPHGRDIANFSSDSQSSGHSEICRNFARGKCNRKANCKFSHSVLPNNNQNSKKNAIANASATTCSYCGKPNHTAEICFKRKRDAANQQDAAAAAAQTNAVQAGPALPMQSPQAAPPLQAAPPAFPEVANLTIGDYRCFLAREADSGDDAVSHAAALSAAAQAQGSSFNSRASPLPTPSLRDSASAPCPLAPIGPVNATLRMTLDGASNVWIVTDYRHCHNVRRCTRSVQVGGDSGPTHVPCNWEGELHFSKTISGKTTRISVSVRIMPGFGANIMPECFYLSRNFSISKVATAVTITAPNGDIALTGDALKHDNSWMFHVDVDVNLPVQPIAHFATIAPVAPATLSVSYASFISDSHDELHALAFTPLADPPAVDACLRVVSTPLTIEDCDDLAASLHFARVQCPAGSDTCFATKTSLAAIDALLHWHYRMGHRNFRDVAELLGIPLPTKLPLCLSCLRAKSKRTRLRKRVDPIHEPIRPGYGFAWDHCGPFAVRTWGGNNYVSLKICTYSGKLFPCMTNSTGTAAAEWMLHVRRLEATAGKLIVAQMITDGATCFTERSLQTFNEDRGIIHVQSPPYTQELNALLSAPLVLPLAWCAPLWTSPMPLSKQPASATLPCAMFLIACLLNLVVSSRASSYGRARSCPASATSYACGAAWPCCTSTMDRAARLVPSANSPTAVSPTCS